MPGSLAADAHAAHALAGRLRHALRDAGASEMRMFGGIGFMVSGHMAVACSKQGLLVRVGPERYDEALRRTGARPMEMRGRPVRGYVRVDPDSVDAAGLQLWVDEALALVGTLPAKTKRKR